MLLHGICYWCQPEVYATVERLANLKSIDTFDAKGISSVTVSCEHTLEQYMQSHFYFMLQMSFFNSVIILINISVKC